MPVQWLARLFRNLPRRFRGFLPKLGPSSRAAFSLPPLPERHRLSYVAGMSRGKHKQPASALEGLFEDLEAGETWDGPWTERQRRFVISYLRHSNGARAVREAGYKCKFEH